MNVVMPQLGETVTEGTIVKWFKAAGDAVQEGETLFEIETDKVTMEIQALASGRLGKLQVEVGSTVPVGAVVTTIDDDLRPGAPKPSEAAGRPVAGKAQQPELVQPATTTPLTSALDPFNEVRTPTWIDVPRLAAGMKVTPLARRLIAQSGLDLDALCEEVGRNGGKRVARAHVLEAIARRDHESAVANKEPVPAATDVEPMWHEVPGSTDHAVLPLNRMRKRSGANLQRAWRDVPHVTQGVEVNFRRVEQARAAWNADLRGDAKLSFLPFIARAVCLAIRDYPQVNASLDGEALLLHRSVNLGVAVDLDHDGLLVPVIKEAQDLTVTGLGRAIEACIKRARTGKLNADDLAGATYTISNSGTFGTLFTTPIVNPPQVAILSTDGISKRVVVIDDDGEDRIAIGRVGILAQSFDHRAFDGAYSAAFLRRLRQIIETNHWNLQP